MNQYFRHSFNMKDDASFPDIPDELQIDILSRLPPKSLSRCKCVSKHWNTTLTIQAFMLRHTLSYDKHSKLAFVIHKPFGECNSVLSFDLSANDNPICHSKYLSINESVMEGHHQRFADALLRRHHMSNICNHLICVFNHFSTRVALLNLKTQDFIHLPALTTENGGRIRFWYALGFDPLSNVYKVLSIYGGNKVCRTKAAILTLGSKHWNPVEYKFLSSPAILNWRYWRCNNRFCLDGVIYWVNDNEIHDTRVVTVVAFDLNHAVFTDYNLVTIPIKDVERTRYYLTSLKGCPTLFIWQMESDEIQQLTLFNHKNPRAAWNRRSFISYDFPNYLAYGCLRTCVAGDSILLNQVKPIKVNVEPQEQDESLLSRYICSDLEHFAVE